VKKNLQKIKLNTVTEVRKLQKKLSNVMQNIQHMDTFSQGYNSNIDIASQKDIKSLSSFKIENE